MSIPHHPQLPPPSSTSTCPYKIPPTSTDAPLNASNY
jgi:hypothetical protein